MNLLSLILELFGFLLTFIEVIFPKIADKIEYFLDILSESFSYWIDETFSKVKEEEFLHESSEYAVPQKRFSKRGKYLWLEEYYSGIRIESSIISRFPLLIIISILGSIALILISLLLKLSPIALVVLSLIPWFIFPFIYFSAFLRFINKYTNDSAIGAIGLFLSFSGLLIELYQYI